MTQREQDQPYRPRHARSVDAAGPTRVEAGWDADEGEGDIEPFAGDAERAPSSRDEP